MSELLVKGIARYPKIMTAKDFKNDGNFKFSVELLIKKGSKECIQVENTFREFEKNTYPTGTPRSAKLCWKDMVEQDPDNELLKDYMVLKLASNQSSPPIVVDSARQKVISPSMDQECIGQEIHVQGKFYSYDKQSKGIACFLNGVMFTGVNGPIPKEALSSKPSADQMFASVDVVSLSPTPNAPKELSKYQMTAKANGATRDAFIANGWTDVMLIEQGYMLPPQGINLSFQ